MNFKPVTQKHEKVLIIGGGESLTNFDINLTTDFEGVIITVNSVILHLPRADYWISGDFARPHVALEERKENCYYYTAYPRDVLSYDLPNRIHYLDKIVPENDNYGLQEDKNKVTGGVDSIYCALSLAYHFEAKEITILGMDCYGNNHWYDSEIPYNGYNNPNFERDHLSNLNKRYSQCIDQFRKANTVVINGSPKSRIDCFPRMDPEEALNYFKE